VRSALGAFLGLVLLGELPSAPVILLALALGRQVETIRGAVVVLVAISLLCLDPPAAENDSEVT